LSRTRQRPKVALLVEMSNAHARRMLQGIRQYIREHGPWLIHYSEQGRRARPPDWLRHWRGDGIIARMNTPAVADAVLATGIPAVDLGGLQLAPSLPSIKSDSRAIGRIAAEHFLERGFKHFGFSGMEGVIWSERRARSFAQVVAAGGHDCTILASPARWELVNPSGKLARRLARWIQAVPKPAAILGAWDGCAVEVLEVCQQLGVAVPDELAVLGVDNDDLLCELAVPPFSSVAVDAHRIGYEAAGMVEQMMAGQRVAAGEYLVPPLGVVTRQSTDVLAIDDRPISEALRFIREHADQGINVEDVLAAVPLSRRVLESRFKKCFEITPHEAIVRVRLQRARQLLAETELPLQVVAERSGFHYAENMSTTFRKRTGVTPALFRAQQRGHDRGPAREPGSLA
jgi:LacI family transcriptional regulator